MKTLDDKINLTSAEILSISENAPEKLFSSDLNVARNEYLCLSRRWHPDHNRDWQATAIFQHVTKLYRKTQELIKDGAWRGAGVLELPAADVSSRSGSSASRQMKYFKRTKFELGDLYLGETNIAFSVERLYADLFENARRQIANFRFATASMQKEIEPNLPHCAEYFTTRERLIMVLPKLADAVLLEDLLEYLGGAIDARHVAWIGSCLHNLACYFEYSDVVHHDISPRTIFVSPKLHAGMLLGGWWYARPTGEKINALPHRTINVAPGDVIRRKQADGRVDLELIRQTGRELLGDPRGAGLKTNKKIPAAMSRWFNGATSGSAVTDYELWRNVLEMDFGKPPFVGLNIEPAAIYGLQ